MNPEGGSCLLGSKTMSFYHCTGVLEAARDRFDLVTVHSLPRVSPNQFWRVQSWNDHQVFFSSPFIVYITWIESAKSSRSVHRSLLIPSWQDRYVFRQYFTFFILGTSFTQQLWTILSVSFLQSSSPGTSSNHPNDLFMTGSIPNHGVCCMKLATVGSFFCSWCFLTLIESAKSSRKFFPPCPLPLVSPILIVLLTEYLPSSHAYLSERRNIGNAMHPSEWSRIILIKLWY